jgi:UDP-N-acetyl-alpha-D-muramoyl-L-alanyl-L-glutamate epimerase
MRNVMSDHSTARADLFRYVNLDIEGSSLRATYELDGRTFVETVDFEGVDTRLDTPAVRAVAELWFLVAGLSYYKAGAARRVDVGLTPLGTAGKRLLAAALHEGLGEFAYRNDLPLDDVVISGGTEVVASPLALDPERVLVPFGGGIDSVVTTAMLADHLDQTLFIVSPSSGRFAPLEATAAVTGLEIVRATRRLDPQLLSDEPFFHGHVPVTAMVTLLAAVAAVASERGGVVMSNEHSASAANLRWDDLEVNHQWSKSLAAEILIADALSERIGDQLVVASFLRDRSEVWVAKAFSELPEYHHVFRSCNRAFAQARERRLDTWCGECDKCLFINLMLAPFLSRAALVDIFQHEPLSDELLSSQLRVLVGVGVAFKPFECVGDPDESAAALERVSQLDEWHDESRLAGIASETKVSRSFESLLEQEGPSRVPTHWVR